MAEKKQDTAGDRETGLAKRIQEEIQAICWENIGIHAPNWKKVFTRYPKILAEIGDYLQEKYGHWTGKTLAKRRGKYVYLNSSALMDTLHEMGVLQFDWAELPPFCFEMSP